MILMSYSLIGDFFSIPSIYGLGKFISKMLYTGLFPRINEYYKRKEEAEINFYMCGQKH